MTEKPLKIAMVSPQYSSLDGQISSYGLGVAVGLLSRGLADKGHQIDVFVPTEKESYEFKDREVNVHARISHFFTSQYISYPQHLGEIAASLSVGSAQSRITGDENHKSNVVRSLCDYDQKLALHLRGNHYDVIHIHDWPHALLAKSVNQSRFLSDKPLSDLLIVTIHNALYQGNVDFFPGSLVQSLLQEHHLVEGADPVSGGRFSYMATLAHYADKLVAVSNSYAISLKDMFPGIINGRIIAIPNGVDIKGITESSAFEKRDYSKQKPVLAIGGRVTPEKGFTVVLEVLPDIAEHFDVKIFGGTNNPHLKYQLEHMTPKNVQYVGELSRTDAIKLLTQSDAFLSASLHAPFEYMPIEALASGAVPILTNVGAHRENFDNVRANDNYKGTAVIMHTINDNLLKIETYVETIERLRQSIVEAVTFTAKAITEQGLREKVRANFESRMASDNPWSIDRFVQDYELAYRY